MSAKQHEERRTAPLEIGLINLNFKVLLRDGSSTLKTPIATRETRNRQQRGTVAVAWRDLSCRGRRAHLRSAAEGNAPARLSPRAARQQVAETQLLGMASRMAGAAAPLAQDESCYRNTSSLFTPDRTGPRPCQPTSLNINSMPRGPV